MLLKGVNRIGRRHRRLYTGVWFSSGWTQICGLFVPLEAVVESEPSGHRHQVYFESPRRLSTDKGRAYGFADRTVSDFHGNRRESE